MKIKMSDIAKKAGVSIAAVSLVLNGKPGVSEKTRTVSYTHLTLPTTPYV